MSDQASPQSPAAPFAQEGHPSGVSRRALMQSGGVLSLATLLASPLFATAASAQTPNTRHRPKHGKHGKHGAHAKRGKAAGARLGAQAGTFSVLPYQIQASAELTEDYFITTQVMVTPQDRLLPFTAPSGQTEAVLFSSSSGTVSHILRDASQQSGWATATINATDPYGEVGGKIADAAVLTGTDGTVILACRQQVEGSVADEGLAFYTVDASGIWSFVDLAAGEYTFAAPQSAPLGAHLDVTGVPAFYLRATGGQVQLVTVPDEIAHSTKVESFAGIDYSDIALMWNPSQTPSAPAGGQAVVLRSDGTLYSYPQTTATGFDIAAGQPMSGDGEFVESLIWAGMPEDPKALFPLAVFQDRDGSLVYSNQLGNPQALITDFGDYAGPGHAATWRTNGLYSFAFLDQGGLISLITGYQDTVTFTDPIPLQKDVSQIFSLPSEAAQDTLFMSMAADFSLQVLTKDSTGAWSQHGIYQPPADQSTITEVESYRVRAQLIDANGVGVPAGQVQITSDRLIGMWLPTGNVALEPGVPQTVTVDASGWIKFAMPADELDSAVLTVQALDSSGKPTNDPFTITPDTDVRAFLAGTDKLAEVGTLNGAALLQARDANGNVLFPNLQGDEGNAAQAVNTLTALANAGLGNAPAGPTAMRSLHATVDASGVQVRTSRRAGAYSLSIPKGKMAEESVDDWWDSVKHDADAVFHALRHGVITATQTVVNWSEDAGQWIVNMTVDVGNGVLHAFNWVVKTFRDAVNAISGFFHTLGADIKAVIDWIKRHVLDALKGAEANAKVIEALIAQVPAAMHTAIGSIRTRTDDFFVGIEGDVKTKFAEFAKSIGDTTFGDQAPAPETDYTGGNLHPKDDPGVQLINLQPLMWLFDKVEEVMAHFGGPDYTADYDQVIADLTDDFGLTLKVVGDLFGVIFDVYGAVLTHEELNEVVLSDLFNKSYDLIEDTLKLLDKVTDTLLDMADTATDVISGLLSYEYDYIPLIGGLLAKIGFNDKVKMQHLVALLAAYPATIMCNETYGGPLFPASSQSGPLGALADDHVDGWGVGLNFSSCAVQGIWTVVDASADLAAAASYGGAAPVTPQFLGMLDIVCPLALFALQWPSPASADGDTNPPFTIANDGASAVVQPFLVVTGLAPTIATIFAKGVTPKEDKNNVMGEQVVPWLTAISGFANCVLGFEWDEVAGSPWWDVLNAVLCNLSYMTAPLATTEMAAESDGATLVAKLLVDAFSGFGACVPMFVDGTHAAGVSL